MTLDLKALRAKWEKEPALGRMATDPAEVLALIDALATARAELAQHEASDKEWERESDAHYTRAYKRGAETARALAMEEAARRLETARLQVAPEFHALFDALPELIRRLAPLPSTLVVLEKSVVEQAKAALRGVETGCDPLSVPLEPMAAVRAALAAMARAK